MRELSHYPLLGELEQPIGLVEGAQGGITFIEQPGAPEADAPNPRPCP
jgi:hypothetical protein